jgi:hypothetical protein
MATPKTMTDRIVIARDMVGDTRSIDASLYLIYQLTSHVYISQRESKSNLLYPRILWSLALDPSISRYKLSKLLDSPHSTTMGIVSELCNRGLLRTGETKKARTGLLSPSYQITSIGLIPVVEFCFPVVIFGPPDNPSELDMARRKLRAEMRGSFSEFAEKTSFLPIVGFFFKKWEFFRKRNVDFEAGNVLSLVLVKDFDLMLRRAVGPVRTLPGSVPEITLSDGFIIGGGPLTHKETIGDKLCANLRESISPGRLQHCIDYLERRSKLSFVRRVMKDSLEGIRRDRKDTTAVKLLEVLCEDSETRELVKVTLKMYRKQFQSRLSSLNWVNKLANHI